MVRATALALLLSTQASAQEIDTALVEWATPHAPDGIDLFPDGSVWVTAGYDPTGTKYMMSAKDMRTSQGKGGYVWLRMDHSRDKTVSHRSSLRRYYFSCSQRQFQAMTWITYKADNTVAQQGGTSHYSQWQMQDVIPGSIGEHWLALACFATK